MVRVAATLLALLAALPAVTPLIGGGYNDSDCRNLTHLGPSERWPDFPSTTYKFTGLLVMPGDTCSGALVNPKFMLSSSHCRFWKENVNFGNDIENEVSEVRIGLIQGEVPKQVYQRQPVKQYFHYKKNRNAAQRYPVMLVEVVEAFSDWKTEELPGIYRLTPLSDKDPRYAGGRMLVEIVGYENSVNMPIFHQSSFEAYAINYKKDMPYGRTKWDLTKEAICTSEVSPVRTVCSIDRGAPVMKKQRIVAIVIGIVDDMQTPGNYCGEGRVHYNVFIKLEECVSWIKEKTNASIWNLEDGTPVEDCDDGAENQKPKPGKPRPPKATTTNQPRDQSGSGRQMVSLGPLLLCVAFTIARFVIQY